MVGADGTVTGMDTDTPAVCTTFTATCPCGETVHVGAGVEQPHEHRPITVQMVRDAWADGYAFAKTEEAP